MEDELDRSLDALDGSDDVASVEVTDGRDGVTVRRAPPLPTTPTPTSTRLVAACGFLQLLDPESDWSGTWAVEVALVDAETGVEVARGTLPAGELSYSRESWDEAVSAGV